MLSYPDAGFLSLAVPGLSEAEAVELLTRRGASWDRSGSKDSLKTLLSLTQGSALQLNLIATQVAKRGATLAEILQRIESGDGPEIGGRILDEMWLTLKDEHRVVLRYLAELPHAETEQRVGSCLGSSLNFNRFQKAVRALKSLNLIIEKAVGGAPEAIELHPLVKDYIRRRFPREEQAPIVARILSFLDQMIVKLRGYAVVGPPSVLENWSSKIEVCVRNGRMVEAVETFHDIFLTLEVRGYTEELLRLAEAVVPAYEVTDSEDVIRKLDVIANAFVCALAHLGRHQEGDFWIERLAKTVPGKSARYIWLCNIRSYALWVRQDYMGAIHWATEGDT
jgi:hypothetical protein